MRRIEAKSSHQVLDDPNPSEEYKLTEGELSSRGVELELKVSRDQDDDEDWSLEVQEESMSHQVLDREDDHFVQMFFFCSQAVFNVCLVSSFTSPPCIKVFLSYVQLYFSVLLCVKLYFSVLLCVKLYFACISCV